MVDQNRRDRRRRSLERKITADRLAALLANPAGLKRLEAVPFEKAQDWQAATAQLTDVQKLVHLAMRRDSVDEAAIRGELLASRRRAYESELAIQIERLGCGPVAPRLNEGPSLTELARASDSDAASIVNTYNYDLARQIGAIAESTPRANRYTYRKRLGDWDTDRAQVKAAQIGQYTDSSARTVALRDFEAHNLLEGEAELEPTDAICPVCQGWIARGKVPLAEATRNPPPYHLQCPHSWSTSYKKLSRRECAELWAG